MHLLVHSRADWPVAASPDDRELRNVEGRSLQLFNSRIGLCVRVINGDDCIVFSHDGLSFSVFVCGRTRHIHVTWRLALLPVSEASPHLSITDQHGEKIGCSLVKIAHASVSS